MYRRWGRFRVFGVRLEFWCYLGESVIGIWSDVEGFVRAVRSLGGRSIRRVFEVVVVSFV